MDNDIFKKISQEVTQIFEKYPHPNLTYHDLGHTRRVVERSEEIAAHYQLGEEEIFVVYASAWFHDVGHLFAEIADHEEESVRIMGDFMRKNQVHEKIIESIAECIRATRLPHRPENLLAEILCDADTYHLGTKEFKKTNKKIRKEYERRGYNTLTLEWEKNTLDLLENHRYFTTYCQVLLSDGKQKNINWARKRYLKTAHDQAHRKEENTEDNPRMAKQKLSLVARGIQTMLRLTSENHLRLSDMADGKANILISVNAIIISVVLSLLIRKLATDTYLTIPTIIFLAFSVATVIIAIMATRPKISEGRFSREDVINKKINLLFFGNFYKSSLEEYEWAMGILMKDKDYLYSSLVKDIHQLGVVLGRKYKLIRIAYTVFTIGLVVSVIAFTLAVLLRNPEQITTVTTSTSTPL